MAFNMNDMQYYVVNAPIPVNFAGLRGTTMAMQAQGWQLAVETDISHYHGNYRIRLAGKHPNLDLRMISYPVEVSRYMLEVQRGGLPHIEFMIHICSEQIMFQVQEGAPVPSFQSIDFSEPMLKEFNMSEFSIDECAFFRPTKQEADIYVPKDEIWTMQKHIDAILDMQKDKQKELREKARKQRKRQGTENDPSADDERVKLQLIAV